MIKKFLSALRGGRRPEERKKLVIHMGMGKTGTTALQVFFSTNREVLKHHGVLYPTLGEVSGAHHRLSPHIPSFLEDSWTFQAAQDWGPRLARTKVKRILLSSELIAWTRPDLVPGFCDALGQWFDLTLVLYVRRQDNIIMASFNQNLKTGQQKRRITDALPNLLSQYDYESRLQPWESAVGPENIVVRPYEKEQFFGNDIRRDFLHHLFGIDDVEDFTFDSANPNPRLSMAASEYLRLVNNVVHEPERKQRFTELLLAFSARESQARERAPGEEISLSPAQRMEIIEANRAGNEAIARRYLGRGDGRLFLEPLPDTGAPWRDTEMTGEEAAVISNYLLASDEQETRRLYADASAMIDCEKTVPRLAARTLVPVLQDAIGDAAAT